MTVQDLITAYGAYYLNSGQNINRILQLPFQKLTTTANFTPLRIKETVYQLSQGSITSILQPFQKKFTPAGELGFAPNLITLNHVKADIELFPDDIEDSWLGFLGGLDTAAKREEWPLIRYAIEYYYLNKINEDRENYAHYKGVYEAPADGVASVPLKSMDGIKKKIQDGIGKGINELVAIGVLAKETVFDQVEAAVDQISNVYQTKPMGVFMSPQMARFYLRDKRAEKFFVDPKNIDTTIDFTPQYVVGLPSMIGTTDLFITPKENLLHLTKREPATFDIQTVDRLVKFLMDWYEGIGFGLNQAVWTNVEAPEPPVGG